MPYILKYEQGFGTLVFEEFKTYESAKQFCQALNTLARVKISLYEVKEVEWSE